MPRISYIFFPDGGGDPVELGDDALGHRVSGGLPSQKRMVEHVTLAFTTRNKRFSRGNWEEQLTWSVDRDHGTLLAAFIFRRDHADTISAKGILQELEEESNTSRFLRDCAFEQIECTQWDGQSTVFRYTVSGSQWTDTLT